MVNLGRLTDRLATPSVHAGESVLGLTARASIAPTQGGHAGKGMP